MVERAGFISLYGLPHLSMEGKLYKPGDYYDHEDYIAPKMQERVRLILRRIGPYSGPHAARRRFRDVLLMISVAAVALAAAIALANAEECRQGSPGAGGAPCTSNVIIGPTDTGCGPSQCAKATEAEATTWITANAGALPWDIIDTCQRRYNDTPTAVHARSVANCLCVETKLRLTRKILNGGK